MELYKFINENKVEKYKSGFVVLDNRIYTNPTEDTLKRAGYKPLVSAEAPEYDESMQYIVKTYAENEDCITEAYEVRDIVVSDD